MKGSTNLLDWKTDVCNLLDMFQIRKVHFILKLTDDQKQSVVQHALSSNLCTEIPDKYKSFKSIMEQAYAAPNKKGFIMHAPNRKGNKPWEFYTAVETLKDGHIGFFRGRRSEQMWFDSPSIVVFTDRFPRLKYIKPDCWLFWHVVEGQLESVKHPKLLKKESK